MSGLFAESPKQAREPLRELADSGNNTAKAMLVAIRKRDRDSLKTYAAALVADGHLAQVIPLLFDPSDVVKQDLAVTLAEVKDKRVAAALLESYAQLDVLVTGGTEVQLRREETKGVFEGVLARLTGLRADPEWTHAQKVQAFSDAIQRPPR